MKYSSTSGEAVHPPGSVADIVAHLVAWCTYAPSGLARVVYGSELARQQVMAEIRQALAEAAIDFQEIALPVHQPALKVARVLEESLRTIPTGVVSLSGFATAFPEEVSLADSLGLFNRYREALAQFPLRQVWWMPRSFAEVFMRAAPDLQSWFMVRLDLTEIVTPLSESPSSLELSAPYVPLEEARRRSRDLVDRFETAREAGATVEDLLALAITALSALLDANDLDQAEPLEREFAQKIRAAFPGTDSTESLGQIALTLSEKAASSELPAIATHLNKLMFLYAKLGHRDLAKSLGQQALAIRRRLAQAHPAAFAPAVAMTLNNLGTVLRDLGAREEARAAYTEALTIYLPLAGRWPRAYGQNFFIFLRNYTTVAPEHPDDPWWEIWRQMRET